MNARPIIVAPDPHDDPSRPSLAGSPACPTTVADRVLEDLQADYERQSGHLSWDDVHQAILGRSLSPSDAVGVWRRASERFLLTRGDPHAPKLPDDELLTATEERVLTRRVAAARLAAEAGQAGILPESLKTIVGGMGKEAFDRLISKNTGLVGSLAAGFAARTTRLDLDDLFQEGVIGLIRAIERFDPDKGYRLSTYATWWIRQHLQRAISSKARTIRLPSHVEESLRQLKKKRSRLRHSLDRTPTPGELAHELAMGEGEVNLLLNLERDADLLTDLPREKGIEAPSSERPSRSASSPLGEVETLELATLLREVLRCLDPRARVIIRQRFELEGRARYTLRQLGEKYDITRERVRQIQARSLARLSQGEGGRALMDYLEE
jgi:RNA polymerase primary sigma factor